MTVVYMVLLAWVVGTLFAESSSELQSVSLDSGCNLYGTLQIVCL